MVVSTKHLMLLATIVGIAASPARADDLADVARQFKLPVPVVDTVLRNVDTYFASADSPANKMTNGLIKELALKTVKAHMNGLEEGGPGKSSETTAEEKNATYKVSLRTTRHEATETAECVDSTAVVTSSEGVPVIKDGGFTFDSVHPKVTTYSWKMIFCRTPQNGGTEFSEWQLK